MKPNQLTYKNELSSLFKYYPADFIEAALLPLIPASINEHTNMKELFYAELNEIIQESLASYQQLTGNRPHGFYENEILADIEEIINILKAIIPVGYIFFQQGIAGCGSLTIILARQGYKPTHEVQETVNFSLLTHPKITAEVFTYGAMNDLIRKGHFYYANRCVLKNCVYQSEVDFTLPLPNPILLAKNKLVGTQSFKQNTNRALNFLMGAERYLKNNENAMAVFMLQQACEFTYKSLIVTFKGKDLKSHQLVVLHKQAKHYLPQVIGLFNAKPKKELQLLTLLQEAYVKARYDHAYQVENLQVVSLMEATSNLITGVQLLFEAHLTSMPHA